MSERTVLKIVGALLVTFLITIMAIGTNRVSAFFSSVDSSGHDSHGHSHDPAEQATEATDDHVGHAPDSNDDHSHHNEALSGRNVLNQYDVEMKAAGPGVLELQTKLTGEVKLNADRVAHVVPQVAGKVREVLKNVGGTVKTGEVMAWIESATLGQAKIDYLSKFAEISCCSIELTRAREIHENATRLLEALETSPSLESLSETNWGPMGKVRSDLISAYAELQYAKNAYEREKRLFDQKITSGDEFQKAESALNKAEALYNATRDGVAFEIRHDLLEATRAQQMRELDLVGAERNLYVLGLTAVDMHALQTLTTSYGNGHSATVCTDPNCTNCAEHTPIDLTEDHAAEPLNANERLAWYPLRAPFDGTVISKHLSLGESVKDNADAFIIADLSLVWVDFRVHQRDVPSIQPGQMVAVDCGQNKSEGVITYVAPVISDDTRTALARVVLANPSGYFRPGTFVNGAVTLDHMKAALVVEKSAIQYMDDQPCVFVYDGHAFDKRNVKLGRTDDKHIEITEGLETGDSVVIKNAFRIKAEMEKSKTALSGHGHVH